MSPRIRIFLLTLADRAGHRPCPGFRRLERVRRRPRRPFASGVAGPDRRVRHELAEGHARRLGRHPAHRAPTSTPSSTRSTAAPRRRQRRRPAPRRSPARASIRFTHRARDRHRHLDRLGRRVRAHRLRRPGQHDPRDQLRLAPGPARRSRSPRPTRPRRSHAEWRVDGGSWNPTGTATVTGTGAHTLDTAAVDSAGNRNERLLHRQHRRRRCPTDTTDTAPVGWQPQAVDLTVDGTDAHSGVDHVEWQIDAAHPGSGPDGTIVPINTQGKHVFRTRVVDEVGNVSALARPGRVDRHPRPDRHHERPDDLVHDPDGQRRHRRHRQRQPRPHSGSSGGSTGSPAATSPTRQQHRPVTVAGDGVHKLEVRMTDARQPRPGLAHAPGQDRHRHPDRPDDVATGWLPLLVAERQRPRHRRPLRHPARRVADRRRQRRLAPSATRTTSRSPATASTRSRPAWSTTPAWPAPGSRARSSSTRPPRPTSRRSPPTGWRNTPYSVVLDGSDALSGVASVSWKLQLQGEAESGEHVGSRRRRDRDDQPGRHAHAEHPRPRHRAAPRPPGAPRPSRSTACSPTDNTIYPCAPVGNRHVITFNRQDDRSGVAAVEWKLDDGAAQDQPRRRRSPATARTRSRCASRTTPATGAPGSTHTITVVLALDTTAPTDNTVDPDAVAHRRVPVDRGRRRRHRRRGRRLHRVALIDDHEIRTARRAARSPSPPTASTTFETRVWDKAGNHTDWKTQTLKIDKTVRRSTRRTIAGGLGQQPHDHAQRRPTPPPAWTASRTTLGIAGTAPSPAPRRGITLAADGDYTISYSIYDVAGQRTNR